MLTTGAVFNDPCPLSLEETNLIGHQDDYGVEYNNKVTNAQGHRVWGYWGIKPLVTPSP